MGTLRTFLLGQVTEAELDAMRNRLITDDALLDSLDLAEDDLIEEYVRGEMPEADREPFHRHFLTTESRKQRLQVIEGVYRLRRAPVVEMRRPAYVWMPAASIAASVIIASGAAFYAYRETAKMRLSVDALAQEMAGSSRASLSFALHPSERRRGPSAAMTTLRVPGGVDSIELQLMLPPGLSGPELVVTITAPPRVQVWSRAPIAARDGAVIVTIPVAALPDGEYQAAVSPAAGVIQPAAYEFRIARQ